MTEKMKVALTDSFFIGEKSNELIDELIAGMTDLHEQQMEYIDATEIITQVQTTLWFDDQIGAPVFSKTIITKGIATIENAAKIGVSP